MYFTDIESVRQYQTFNDVPTRLRELYISKHYKNSDEYVSAHDHYTDRAALLAEFGKICCITVGKIVGDEIRLKTFCSRFEKILLQKFAETIDKEQVVPLCAHNGKEFDFPYLLRRFIVNGLPVPKVLQTYGVYQNKWDLHDTMEMWSGTQWKYKISLDLLCEILGIESPKGDITGADIGSLYYSMFEGGEGLAFDKETEVLGKISAYNQRDTVALAKVWSRLNGYAVPTIVKILE